MSWAWRIFLAATFFFVESVFPPEVLGAITIESVSPTTIDSDEDIITINASASGLSSSTQYLQAVFTKDGSATNYLGFTKNLSDEWYQYKSSPSSSDLGGYFYRFQPLSGTWSGIIRARFDSGDDGFSGPGNYLLRLAKYISSSPSYSDPVSVLVNIASSTGSITEETTTPAAAPEITWEAPLSGELGEVFNIKAAIKNFNPNKDYYLKVRGGVTEGELNKSQTVNGSVYLWDGDSWSRFPTLKTNDRGEWSGEVKARVGEDKEDGKYYFKLRFRNQNTESFYESGTKEINLRRPAEKPKAEVVVTAGNSNPGRSGQAQTKVGIKEARQMGEVLATESAASISTLVRLASESGQTINESKRNKLLVLGERKDFWVSAGLMGLGGVLILGVGGYFLYNRYDLLKR